MTDPIEVIRAALVDGAPAEARSAGAAACRAILAVLEPAPTQESPPTPLLTPELAQQVAVMLRTMNPEQLLDTAIAKLRALEATKPQAAPAQAIRPLSIPMVGAPHRAKRG
jgi:hypothetical protein